MLNESLFLSSFDQLKNLLLHELTMFNVALVYVLLYVVYKALGRYIYFKPQEHASKVNRTFLTLSLFTVLIHSLDSFTNYLPFLPEYRWFYVLCGLVILIAPLSILMDKVIWNYDRHGGKSRRNWHYEYLPIYADYYKTSVSKSEQVGGGMSQEYEIEVVESTRKNIHSDALLNILALTVFISVNGKWAYESATNYGFLSYVFSVVICVTIAGIFFDSAIFSWIHYLELNIKKFFKH